MLAYFKLVSISWLIGKLHGFNGHANGLALCHWRQPRFGGVFFCLML